MRPTAPIMNGQLNLTTVPMLDEGQCSDLERYPWYPRLIRTPQQTGGPLIPTFQFAPQTDGSLLPQPLVLQLNDALRASGLSEIDILTWWYTPGPGPCPRTPAQMLQTILSDGLRALLSRTQSPAGS